MDDYGNQLHWHTQVQGWHCMGLYGYAPGYGGYAVLAQSIDFADLEPTS